MDKSIKRTVSPGISAIIPLEIQEILWGLHEEQPLLPSIYELEIKGKDRCSLQVKHICLLPYYEKKHRIQLNQPSNLQLIRITIFSPDQENESDFWHMRLSNKQLEAEYSQQKTRPEQGTLF